MPDLIWWLIVGAIAGFLADMVMKTRGGMLMNIIVGIIGAIVGGWLFSALGLNLGMGIIGSIIVAFIGAVIAILIIRALPGRSPV